MTIIKEKEEEKKKKQKRTIEVWTCDLEFYKTPSTDWASPDFMISIHIQNV